MENSLRKINAALGNLSDRIAKLEGQNRYTTSTDWMRGNWWGWCSPTQPASRIIQIHSGLMWWWQPDTGGGYLRKMGDLPYDLAGASAFAGERYYRWAILSAVVSTSNIANVQLDEGDTEFGTWDECEADFWWAAPDVNMFGSVIPLCALVLRNSGYLTVAGAIENVTLADREQSYFLVRDMRPWLHVHVASA